MIRFGLNVVPRRPPASFFELCRDALEDVMLRVLMVAGCISLAIGIAQNPKSGWIEGFAVLLAGVCLLFFLLVLALHLLSLRSVSLSLLLISAHVCFVCWFIIEFNFPSFDS